MDHAQLASSLIHEPIEVDQGGFLKAFVSRKTKMASSACS